MVSSIRKRDARIVPFDVNKIAQAIFRAASSQGGKDYVLSLKIAAEVLERLNEQFEDAVPDVEQVQDLVEKTLIKSGHARTAKAYILYRHQRTKIREMNTRLMTTIRNSDCIMVMEQGRIIERGSHDELIHRKGKYYQLYTGNFEEAG